MVGGFWWYKQNNFINHLKFIKMKTIEIKIYKFDELSEQAKQCAISKNSDINVDFDWWNGTYEDAKNIGLEITNFELDRNKHAAGNFNLSAYEVTQNITLNHGEQCDTYKTAANFIKKHNPLFCEYMDERSEHYESADREAELLEVENTFLNDLLGDYATILQNESEYLQSNEAIIETIKANDYDFLESGEMY